MSKVIVSGMKRRVIELWKKSKMYHLIDNMISAGFQRRLKNDNFTILCSNCIGGGNLSPPGKTVFESYDQYVFFSAGLCFILYASGLLSAAEAAFY